MGVVITMDVGMENDLEPEDLLVPLGQPFYKPKPITRTLRLIEGVGGVTTERQYTFQNAQLQMTERFATSFRTHQLMERQREILRMQEELDKEWTGFGSSLGRKMQGGSFLGGHFF